MKSIKPFIYLMLLLVLMPLAGCDPTQEQIATETTTAQTATAVLWTPTSTIAPTLPPTVTPTIAPTLTPTSTSTPTPTQMATTLESTSFQLKDLTFSIVIPEGWEKATDPDRVILSGPTTAGIKTIITFSLDQYSMGGVPFEGDELGISLFSAHVQNTISEMVQNMVSESEDFLTTPDGKPYFRWIMDHKTNGKEIHQAFYIFGSGKWFMTIMYGRAKSAGTETDVLIDEAMKTLRFGQ